MFETVVDRTNEIKASKYHRVDKEGIDIQKLTSKCDKMKASMHITKDLYNKYQ